MFAYLNDNRIPNLRRALSRLVKPEPQLKHLLAERHCTNPALYKEAAKVIDTVLGEQEEEEQPWFFGPKLKALAEGLDFGASPRTTRDSECNEIKIKMIHLPRAAN